MNKDKAMNIRVTNEEFDIIVGIAKQNETTVSKIIRDMIRVHALPEQEIIRKLDAIINHLNEVQK